MDRLPRPHWLLLLFLNPLLSYASVITFDYATLPSNQGWQFNSLGDSSTVEGAVFQTTGTILQMNTMGTGLHPAGSSSVYTYSNVIDPTKSFELKARARVLTTESVQGEVGWGLAFTVAYDNQALFFGISGENLSIGPAGSSVQYLPFDGTVFHDFKLVGDFLSLTSTLYVDGVSYGLSGSISSLATNALEFGDGSGKTNANAEIAYYEFSQPAESVPSPPMWSLLLFGFVAYNSSNKLLHPILRRDAAPLG